MRRALAEILVLSPDLEIEGEMAADSALSEEIRREIFPHSRLKGAANLLVMPTLDAANIAFNMMTVLAEAQPIGPILLGAAMPVHILTPSVTARGVVNISAIATVDAQVSEALPTS
jgi:malate dehydrogenase (oxaloacetate-decarboxylating)(NADP+)